MATERPVTLSLRLSESYGARRVSVCGDFTAWVPVDVPSDGHDTFAIQLVVPQGQRWHYRFCLDDRTWINDPAADDYDLERDGSGISVRFS